MRTCNALNKTLNHHNCEWLTPNLTLIVAQSNSKLKPKTKSYHSNIQVVSYIMIVYKNIERRVCTHK